MHSVGFGILAIVAFLTGGCSIAFLAAMGEYSYPFSFIGLAIAAFCLLVMYLQRR